MRRGAATASMLLVFASIAGCGGDGSSATATAEATPTQSSSATESARAGLDAFVWYDVESEAFGDSDFSFMRDVSASSSMVIAAGQVGDRETLWRSRDGVSWEALPQALGSGDISVGALLSVGEGGRWIAVGVAGGDSVAAVWLSDDGEAWERVSSDALASPHGRVGMLGVAAGPEGLVAGGFYISSDEYRAAFWRSPDGSSWTQLGPEAVSRGSAAQSQVEGIVRVSSGFVAYGWEATNFSPVRPAIWWSANGDTWERTDAEGPSYQESNVLRGVAEHNGGLLAVGNSGAGPLLLHSPDGRVWTRQEFSSDYEGQVTVTEVLATHAGFILLGEVTTLGPVSGLAFVSANGLHWTKLDPDGVLSSGRPNRATMFDNQVIAVGHEQTQQGEFATVWRAE